MISDADDTGFELVDDVVGVVEELSPFALGRHKIDGSGAQFLRFAVLRFVQVLHRRHLQSFQLIAALVKVLTDVLHLIDHELLEIYQMNLTVKY